MNLETYCPIPFSEMFIRPDGRVLICCDTQKAVGNVNSTVHPHADFEEYADESLQL